MAKRESTFEVVLGMTDAWMKNHPGKTDKIARYKQGYRKSLEGLFAGMSPVHAEKLTFDFDAAGNPVKNPTKVNPDIEEIIREVANKHLAKANKKKLSSGTQLLTGEVTGGCCRWEGKVWKKCKDFTVEMRAANTPISKVPMGINLTDIDKQAEWIPLVVTVTWECEITAKETPAGHLGKKGAPKPKPQT